MTLTVIYQHTMNTKTSPETRINQTDDFHALLECIHRFVLQVMDQTAELALRIQGELCCLASIRCFYYLPFPWYVHAILPCWYHEYHASWREDRAQSLASCVHATITDHEYQALIIDNAYTYLSILFTTIQEMSKLSNVESSLGTFFIHTGNRTTWTPWAHSLAVVLTFGTYSTAMARSWSGVRCCLTAWSLSCADMFKSVCFVWGEWRAKEKIQSLKGSG